jgi:hypothetical protein
MTRHRDPISDERDLTSAEARLVRWLLEHGAPRAREFLPQLRGLRVVSRCLCGCPSIDFVAESPGGMEILADYAYDDPDGHGVGVYLFASGGRLAGLEIWSIEGNPIRSVVPDPNVLRPLA